MEPLTCESESKPRAGDAGQGPAVSVVIATYNGAAYIREALESVFGQTVRPAEIVVVDDASTDHTVEMVAGMASAAPVPLRLVRRARNSGGPAGPMNLGARLAATEIVALLDQDDRLSPGKIEAVGDLFRRFPRSGLVFGQECPFEEGGGLRPYPAEYYACFPEQAAELAPEAVLESLFTHGYRMSGAGGTAFRKQAWEEVGGFDRRFRISWDFDFAVRLAARGWAFAYSPTLFQWHRLHRANLNDACGGWLVYCENQWVQLNALRRGGLPATAACLLRERVVPELLNLGFWERRIGRPQRALWAYLLALRYGKGLGVATRGMCRVAAKAVHDLIWGTPRGARP